MNSGIYKILNTVNGKIYIGSASDISNRKACHFSELRKNSHANKKLQAAYNKYGDAAFEFSIVELCRKDVLLVREQYWIDTLDCVRIGYNIVGIAGTAPSCKGKKLTAKHKAKIGKARLGKKRAPFPDECREKLKIASRCSRPNQSRIMKDITSRPEYKEKKLVSCAKAWETRRRNQCLQVQMEIT